MSRNAGLHLILCKTSSTHLEVGSVLVARFLTDTAGRYEDCKTESPAGGGRTDEMGGGKRGEGSYL